MKTNKFLLFIVASCVTLPSCSWFHHEETAPPSLQASPSTPPSSSAIVTLTSDADFKTHVIDSNKPTIVKFTATWCGACKTIQPLYEEIAREHKDGYTFAVLDVDHARSLAKEYNIQGIPAFLFFNKGKEVNKALRIVGTMGKAAFIAKMNQALQPAVATTEESVKATPETSTSPISEELEEQTEDSEEDTEEDNQ